MHFKSSLVAFGSRTEELERERNQNRTLRSGRTAARAGIHWLAAALLSTALSGCLKTPDRFAQSTLDVKVNPPANFELEGEPFCFVG